MSIPLDRLYHFLSNLCGDNTIIYRWYPHGSRKLEDLSSIGDLMSVGRLKRQTSEVMICHDQEPLNYELYSTEDFLKIIESKSQLTIRQAEEKEMRPAPWTKSDKFKQILAAAHFRAAIDQITNVHEHLLLCHSERNSDQLKKFESNGFIGVYYWAHALIARDWFRFAEHDSALSSTPESVCHDFLIYNRAWSGTREYRLKLIELLLDNNLLQYCNTKFSAIDQGIHYTAHQYANPGFSIKRSDIEHFLLDNTTQSTASGNYESQDYAQSAIEVVLETLFDDQRQHLTEKSLRPIACGKPFIIAGAPGTLEYLRSYGFKTFDGLIDESYDKIADPLLRLSSIVAELKRIAGFDRQHKVDLWNKLNVIANYNKSRFFSTEFHNLVVNEFLTNYRAASEKSNSSISTKWFELVTDPELVGPDPITDVDHYNQFLNWVQNYNCKN